MEAKKQQTYYWMSYTVSEGHHNIYSDVVCDIHPFKMVKKMKSSSRFKGMTITIIYYKEISEHEFKMWLEITQ